MSETPKQLPDLLTALADNTTAQITPEDIRDVVVSLYPSRGQLELAPGGSAATTFAGTNQYVKVAGTTAVDSTVCSTCVTQPANGVLKFLKPQTQILLVNATLEVLPASNNQRYTFTFAKNGVAIPALSYTAFYGNLSGNPAGVFLSGLVRVVGDDEISVVVKNETSTASLTAAVLTLSGVGFMV